MSLFENFFKVLSLYFEASNRIRIKLMRFCKTRQITVKAKYIDLMCDLKLLCVSMYICTGPYLTGLSQPLLGTGRLVWLQPLQTPCQQG